METKHVFTMSGSRNPTHYYHRGLNIFVTLEVAEKLGITGDCMTPVDLETVRAKDKF